MAKKDLKDYSDADYRDMLGRKIEKGQFVAYPSMTGSSCYMNIGYVVRVWYKERVINDYRTKLEKTVKDARLTIYTINHGTFYNKTTLYRPDYCIVLDDDYLPETYTDGVAGIQLKGE